MSKIQTSIQKVRKSAKRRRPDGIMRRGPEDQAALSDKVNLDPKLFEHCRTIEPNHGAMEKNRLVTEIEDRAVIAAYKIMRTRVLQRMRSNNWRTLIVTSAGAGEGKSLTAANLALSLSRDISQSILLVDLDLQRSKIAHLFGIDGQFENGINDYLTGDAQIKDIVYNLEGISRISIIPNRTTLEDSSDLLAGPRMRDFVAWVRQQSEKSIVIFDMPPVLVGDDVLMFVPEVDAVLLVVTQGKTERTLLEKSKGLLADANLLGVVLNKCSEKDSSTAYGYY